jgi:hypothetical protein
MSAAADSPYRPIVNRTSLPHQTVLYTPPAYPPNGVPDSQLVLGKHSGRHALAMRCEQLGFQFDRRELDEIYRRFVVLVDKIKHVEEHHLLELIQLVRGGPDESGPHRKSCQSRAKLLSYLQPDSKWRGAESAVASCR